MQFIITAYDGTDENALERRMSVRPQHLENIQNVKKTGSVICAGGILNDDKKPIGSVLVMEYETKEQLDDYLQNEPYVKAGVWQTIKVEPFNTVIVQDEMIGK